VKAAVVPRTTRTSMVGRAVLERAVRLLIERLGEEALHRDGEEEANDVAG
jgi:hypothetical protein